MSERYSLENEFIKIEVDTHGAELKSLRDKRSGRELMWSGDPHYWGRTSPVLFPLVGNYKDKKTIYRGEVFESGQHGFARDMEFKLVSKMEDELWFALSDSDETRKQYPFHFSLLIGYRTSGRNLRVMWNVMNQDKRAIYFSIGGHPAFNCAVSSCAIEFDTDGPLIADVLDENGLVSGQKIEIPLQDSKLLLMHELFDNDALILEKQVQQATLIDERGEDVLTMSFDAPLLGLWTPAGKNAPFICIEPWYGRTDRASFEGDLTTREWGNRLGASDVFSAHYEIEVGAPI